MRGFWLCGILCESVWSASLFVRVRGLGWAVLQLLSAVERTRAPAVFGLEFLCAGEVDDFLARERMALAAASVRVGARRERWSREP